MNALSKGISSLILCIFLPSLTFAQDTVAVSGYPLPVTHLMDSLFQNLNKSRIFDSVLYDRVFPFADLTTDHSGDTLRTVDYVQILSEIQRADYHYVPDDSVIDHRNIETFFYSENHQNRIPIVTLNYNFSSIDSASFDDGRIDTANGTLFYDGANTNSPYNRHNVTKSFLGVDMDLDSGTAYSLQFLEEYNFGNNAGYSISSVEIYDGLENTTWSVGIGNNTSISFNVIGNHILSITTHLSNNITLSSTQQIGVFQLKSTSSPCNSDHEGAKIQIQGSYAWQGYGEPQAYYGKADYKIYYNTKYNTGNGNCTLNSPVIILDGFEERDHRTISNIYDYRLAYDKSGVSDNLGKNLRALGYDVVILNFPEYEVAA